MGVIDYNVVCSPCRHAVVFKVISFQLHRCSTGACFPRSRRAKSDRTLGCRHGHICSSDGPPSLSVSLLWGGLPVEQPIWSSHRHGQLPGRRWPFTGKVGIKLLGNPYRVGTIPVEHSQSWMLMPWLLASPGHQHPWYWLCRIGKFFSMNVRYGLHCAHAP